MSQLQLITSREYKLILNGDRFSNRERGCQEFLEIVEFLAKECGGELKIQQKEKRRRTWYVDTPELALQQKKFVLRVREENGQKYKKVMLKSRSSDRYLSAVQPIHSPQGKPKFEEDITPPFISKFSKSCSIELSEKRKLKTVGDIVELFPGLKEELFPELKELDIFLKSPVKKVNGFTAHEVVLEAGQIKFGKEEKASVKVCFSFWYLFERAEGFPLIGEFSFDYNADNNNEDFSIEVIMGANQFFVALQKQVGWLDFNNTTKTAYAYESL